MELWFLKHHMADGRTVLLRSRSSTSGPCPLTRRRRSRGSRTTPSTTQTPPEVGIGNVMPIHSDLLILGRRFNGFQGLSLDDRTTGWGGHLFRRFCCTISESSICLLGQHGSCSTAQQPGNSQKKIYETFRTSKWPPHLVHYSEWSYGIKQSQLDKTVFALGRSPFIWWDERGCKLETHEIFHT